MTLAPTPHSSKPPRDISAPAGLVIPGVIGGIVMLFLGFFPSGAGHGWGGPLIVSLPMAFVLPMVLVRARIGKRSGMAWDIGLIGFGVAADYFLFSSALSFGRFAPSLAHPSFIPGVDRSVLPIVVVWLVIWTAWQWLAMRTLLRHLLEGARV